MALVEIPSEPPRPAPAARAGHDSAMAAIRGEDPALRRALAIAERTAQTGCSILVVGETGTGKELVARAIHEASPRAALPFVPLNCGAIPRELVESELFGHERGAFTGATAPRDGVFVEADGGTLFLDELGELPLLQQPHLLRVLETGRVRRVGGRGEIPVDVRIVAATHRLPEPGSPAFPLRLDLYHRLATITIEVPPLRRRRGDIPALVSAFVAELEPVYGRRHVPQEAMQALLDYAWPGNVRELRHAIFRAVVLCDDALTPEALLPSGRAGEFVASDAQPPATERRGVGLPVARDELALRAAMLDAYARCGSLRAAARFLGMPKSTFADRARRLGILGAPTSSPRQTRPTYRQTHQSISDPPSK